MLRTVCAAVCLIAIGFAALCGAAWAQERSHQAAPRSMTFGERLDRIRRNLIGDDEEPQPAPNVRSHHNHNHAHPQANPSQTPKGAPQRTPGSASPRTSSGAAPRAANSPAPKLTRQSAVKVQTSHDARAAAAKRAEPQTSGERSLTAPTRPAPSSRKAVIRDDPPEVEEQTPEESEELIAPSVPGEAPEEAPELEAEEDEFDAPAKLAPAEEEAPQLSPDLTPRHFAPKKSVSQPRQLEKGALFSRRSPALAVETRGPRRVMVGRPAEYVVRLKNEGDTAAADVVALVNLPTSVELQDSQLSAGAATPVEGALEWTIDSLPAGAQEELTLVLIPRENHPFDLAVRWSSAAVASNATVEVQQAKLELKISGARQVLCGAKEVYRLSVSNPGNGDAENVSVRLMPLVPGEGEASTHKIGTIAAGDMKTVEIELVARQGGQLVIRAEAMGDGDLTAVAAEEVAVLQPALDVKVAAPSRQYAGAVASYEIHLQNPGDAEAKHVKLAATLPAEAEFVTATRGGKFDAKRNRVIWTLDNLAPGAEEIVTIRCTVQAAGENRLEATAIADGDLKESHVAVTEVIAVADLVLDVSDPAGPVAVGGDAIYELRVKNRGSKAAEGVEISAFYSKGIEPVSAEGGSHEISPGTVVFTPISKIAAGEETVFKIHARADASGTHRFRVELQCKPLGTKLSQEETTLFYSDEPEPRQIAKPEPAGAAKLPRTAEKPAPKSLLR